jgi:hypothetical protein
MSADRPMSMRELDLDAALRDLGSVLAPPTADGLAERVRARIEAERPRRATVPWWLTLIGRERGDRAGRGTRFRRSLILAAAALLLVAAAVTAAIGYGLPGLRILFGPVASPGPSSAAPPGPSSTPGALLGLGTPFTLEEVASLVAFDVLLPPDPAIGPPDAVYVAGQRVSLVWAPNSALPGTVAQGVGLLIVEVQATIDEGMIQKIIDSGTTVEAIAVDEAPGYWIAGASHEILFIGPDGEPIQDSRRLAGNTLVWTRDGITYRLEGQLTRGEAIALAESLS